MSFLYKVINSTQEQFQLTSFYKFRFMFKVVLDQFVNEEAYFMVYKTAILMKDLTFSIMFLCNFISFDLLIWCLIK